MDDSLKQTLLALAARLDTAHAQDAIWIAKDVARKLKKLTLPSASSSLLTHRESEILRPGLKP